MKYVYVVGDCGSLRMVGYLLADGSLMKYQPVGKNRNPRKGGRFSFKKGVKLCSGSSTN